MKLDAQLIKNKLPLFGPDLIEDIVASATLKTIHEQEVLLRDGQFVKHIPVVLDGLIKVFTNHEGREFLLYYIQASESCIMSFSAILMNEPSKIIAKTETESTLLLLPIEKVQVWTHQHYTFNHLFYQQYNQRYTDLLGTINSVLFSNMDQRLFLYLKEKSEITGSNPLKLVHKDIANELGTAREVISRVLKKLEADGRVFQDEKGIHLN